MDNTITLQMKDEFTGKMRTVEVLSRNGAIFLRPQGFGNDEGPLQWPVMLEVYAGRVRVIAWNHKDKDDPVIVELEDAKIGLV